MRALVIPVGSQAEIEVADLDGFEDYQKVIGGFIETIPFPGRDDVAPYFDEEGKIKGLDVNLRATQILKPVMFPDDFIVGTCIFVGFDPDTGDDQDLPEEVIVQIKEALNG